RQGAAVAKQQGVVPPGKLDRAGTGVRVGSTEPSGVAERVSADRIDGPLTEEQGMTPDGKTIAIVVTSRPAQRVLGKRIVTPGAAWGGGSCLVVVVAVGICPVQVPVPDACELDAFLRIERRREGRGAGGCQPL